MCVDEDDDLQMGIYLKVQEGNTIKMHFGKQAEVVFGEERAKENAVLDFITETGLDFNQITGFGTETMCAYLGARGGLVTMLKQHNPMIVNACKPITLAAAQVSDDVQYFGTFEAVVTGVIKFYHDNKEKGEGLQEIQQVLQELELKHPNYFCWLSHSRAAVGAIRRNLPAIMKSMESEAESERWTDARIIASALDSWMKEFKFIATLLFVSDVLSCVSEFLNVFPGASVNFAQAQDMLEDVVTTIERFKTEAGQHLKNLDSVIADLTDHDINLSAEASEDAVNDFNKSVKIPYIESLISHLRCQFPTNKVVSLFGVFDPVNLQIIESQNQWGEEKIVTLAEWGRFQKHLLIYKEKTVKDVLQGVFQTEVIESFPLMKRFLSALCVLPVSKKQFERHLERMHRLKTDLRDSIDLYNDMQDNDDLDPLDEIDTAFLDDYRRIKIEGPTLDEFDFMAAAKKWVSTKRSPESNTLQL